MLSRLSVLPAAAGTVILASLAIATTGLLWLLREDWASFWVALAALLLLRLPAQLIQDDRLRSLLSVVAAVLLSAHIMLGMQLGLYESSRLYDKAMHLLGSAAVASVLSVGLLSYCRQANLRLPPELWRWLVFAGTVCAGAFWEIFEFSVDQTGLFVAQKGLQDTMIDLIANALGALLALFWAPQPLWRRRSAVVQQYPGTKLGLRDVRS